MPSAYANLLYNWKCFQKRCEVLKRSQPLSASIPDPGYVDLSVSPCQQSGKSKPEVTPPGKCTTCQSHNMICLLCCLPVRGLATLCFVCGHGGHLDHVQQWFALPQSNRLCAAPGCGCPCLQFLAD